jgi:hypothetical protein
LRFTADRPTPQERLRAIITTGAIAPSSLPFMTFSNRALEIVAHSGSSETMLE